MNVVIESTDLCKSIHLFTLCLYTNYLKWSSSHDMSLTFVHPEHIQHLSTAQCLAVTESQLHLSPTISSEEGAGCDGAGVLLLSDHAVALDVDHDVLDVGVP